MDHSHMKRPNILFIMADQMAAPILPMHDPASPIKVPNLMRLATEGVVFDSAYCNSPLCAPSRFTLVPRKPSAAISVPIPSYRKASAGAPHWRVRSRGARLSGI